MPTISTNNKTKNVNPERGHTLAWLWRLGLISEEAMHELAGRVSTQIMPSNTRDVMQLVDEAVTEVQQRLGGIAELEPWLGEIKKIEKRVANIEKLLTAVHDKLKTETSALNGRVAKLQKDLEYKGSFADMDVYPSIKVPKTKAKSKKAKDIYIPAGPSNSKKS